MISKFFENANPTSRIIKIKAKDRSVWENVPEAMRKEIIRCNMQGAVGGFAAISLSRILKKRQ